MAQDAQQPLLLLRQGVAGGLDELGPLRDVLHRLVRAPQRLDRGADGHERIVDVRVVVLLEQRRQAIAQPLQLVAVEQELPRRVRHVPVRIEPRVREDCRVDDRGEDGGQTRAQVSGERVLRDHRLLQR